MTKPNKKQGYKITISANVFVYDKKSDKIIKNHDNQNRDHRGNAIFNTQVNHKN